MRPRRTFVEWLLDWTASTNTKQTNKQRILVNFSISKNSMALGTRPRTQYSKYLGTVRQFINTSVYTVQYSTVLYICTSSYTVLYCTVHHFSISYSTVQYSIFPQQVSSENL
jgi:hypothetical protein